MKKVIVIGAGFSGLSTACYLAAAGYNVTVIEKHDQPGGRARKFEEGGFIFDMGPSWYWMPDIFENFFSDFGRKVADFYELKRLDPSYQVIFENDQIIEIPAGLNELFDVFEKTEPGSSYHLKRFLKEAKYKYETGMRDFASKPSLSFLEFIDRRLLMAMLKLDMGRSISSVVKSRFKESKLQRILEFPVLFLGAPPQDIPALYSLMNYADLSLGTWYPMGGMYKIVEGMYHLAKSLGVRFEFGQNLERFTYSGKNITGVQTQRAAFNADLVVASCDYHHVDSKILAPEYKNYSTEYWAKRTMAPSSLIFYLGINKSLKNIRHHNLFFDEDFDAHADEIYRHPKWPSKPLFYVCCPSKTDSAVAPEDGENIFILIPVAPDLKASDEIADKYFDEIITKLESHCGEPFRENIVYKKTYSPKNFVSDYNAFKGNAYGLANTLRQTAFLKPKMKNKHLNNLYFTGQLTVPGPGVPPSIISGKIVSKLIRNEHPLKAKNLSKQTSVPEN